MEKKFIRKPLRQYTDLELRELLEMNESIELPTLAGICSEVLRRIMPKIEGESSI